jgi:Spy/CpxP family protein refolding chaperone
MSQAFHNDSCRTASTSKLIKYRVGVLLLAIAVFPRTSASAQASEAGTPRVQTPPHSSRKSNIDARVKVLAKSLDLTEEQQAAVKSILEARLQQTLLIRRDPSISGSVRIDRFRALQDATVERIRAVLNEEQKKKYDPMAARQIQSTPEHSVEDWLKASTPK